MQKRGLGRGLESLIPGAAGVIDAPLILSDDEQSSLQELPVNKIVPNPKQPRKTFEEEALNELVTSMQEHGLIQPVVVRKTGELYELIVGERRWRAAKEAGIEKLPAIVRDATDAQAIELALIENLQRQDLNAIEEATAIYHLHEDLDMTTKQIAEKLGKDDSTICNSLRMLKLPEEVQEMVIQKKMGGTHARTLLMLPDRESQLKLAERILQDGLTVRQVETLAKLWSGTPLQRQTEPLPTRYRKIQKTLASRFNSKVGIKMTGKQSGRVTIHFKTEAQLQEIFKHFGIE